jgi:hypothetical protein
VGPLASASASQRKIAQQLDIKAAAGSRFCERSTENGAELKTND